MKVKIKIVNYRGPKKDLKISYIFSCQVFASLFCFYCQRLAFVKKFLNEGRANLIQVMYCCHLFFLHIITAARILL